VEIQLKILPEMKERTIYYQSKLITEQITSGQNYSEIKRVVSIIITNDIFFPEDKLYHHQFRYRTLDGNELTNLSEINILELKRLPKIADNTQLWYWMQFIKSDDEEVIDMLAQNNPHIKKAVGILKELSADERTRMLYEDREKTRRDIESMIGGARKEGRVEGIVEGRVKERIALAHKLLQRNLPINEIIDYTGLTQNEIDTLARQHKRSNSYDLEPDI